MKTSTLGSSVLAGAALALGAGLTVSTVLAGPGSGVSIWRNKPEAPPSAPAPAATVEASRCSDARIISVKESKWVRGLGRGMVVVDAGKAVVCNTCSSAVAAPKAHDRNANGPKAALAAKPLHDCTKAGCGVSVASTP